jgi:hypothetical protein
MKHIYFDIKFKMKVVNDKLDYIDESDKKKGYNLKDGRNIYKTGLVNEVTAKAGLVWSKKLCHREKVIHCFNTLRYCGVVHNSKLENRAK